MSSPLLRRVLVVVVVTGLLGVAGGIFVPHGRGLRWGPITTTTTTTLSPRQACQLPCMCLRLSRWTTRMRAHCIVSTSFIRVRHIFVDTSVDEVDFTSSKIDYIRTEYLVGLEHIKVLRMDEVSMRVVHPNTFVGMPELWSLSLVWNKLESLADVNFQRNQRLHHLSLRGNPLRLEHSQPLVVAPSLRVLDVAHCGLHFVDKGTFRGLPSLRQLNLKGNSLDTLPADAVSPLQQLSRLFLEANQLLFFPSEAIKSLPQLLELRLDNNTEMEGPLGPLVAPRLQQLSAAGCALDSVQPNLLVGAPELRYLDVSRNLLSSLWLAGEPNKSRLVLLDASNNPLECDCQLRDTWTWAQHHVDEARVFCGDPPQSWNNISLQKLKCGKVPDSAATSSTSGGAGMAVLWMCVSLLLVLLLLGGALFLVYRQELVARYFSPQGRAAASRGNDAMPLEENSGDDASSEQAQEGGNGTWLD